MKRKVMIKHLDLNPIKDRLDKITKGPWNIPQEIQQSFSDIEDCMCSQINTESCFGETYEFISKELDGSHYHKIVYYHDIESVSEGYITGVYDYDYGGILCKEDTEFISHTPSDIKNLINEVEILREELDKYSLSFTAIEELHQPDSLGFCTGCGCNEYGDAIVKYPCPTIEIIPR